MHKNNRCSLIFNMFTMQFVKYFNNLQQVDLGLTFVNNQSFGSLMIYITTFKTISLIGINVGSTFVNTSDFQFLEEFDST